MVSPLTKKRRLFGEEAFLRDQIKRLTDKRAHQVLTREERIDILRVYFSLKVRHLNTGFSVDLHAEVAFLLGRAKGTVSKVVKEWGNVAITDGATASDFEVVISPLKTRGNRNSKVSVVPNTPSVRYMVRDYVRERRLRCQRVTARQIMDFLVEKGVLQQNSENDLLSPTTIQSLIRAVQRYLIRSGFCRGKKARKFTVKYEHVAWRNRYIRLLLKNRSLPLNERLREVYLDESYVHHHYCRSDNSVYDPLDPEYEEPKSSHKGRRYCFLAAMGGAGKTTGPSMIPGSVWSFCPQHKKDSRVDYHKNFNSSNFVTWFRTQLLPNLGEPSLIIMDNASYHKSKPVGTPVAGRMKKADVIDELKKIGLQFSPDISSVEAKLMLRNWVNDNVRPEICTLAEEFGHKVVFTPPHYSDLQPIELLWAYVKGRVGKEYSSSTTLQDVKCRLDKEFTEMEDEYGQGLVGRLIGHVDKKIAYFQAETELEDGQASNNEEPESDASDDDSDSSDDEISA